MSRSFTDQSGLTLVDALLSVAILVMLLAAVIPLMLNGQRAGRALAAAGEASQGLHLAMEQIVRDLSYGHWDSATPTHGEAVSALVYRTHAMRLSEAWEGLDPEWPGDLVGLEPLQLRYHLEGSDLIREIREVAGPQRLHSRELVAKGLQPEMSQIKADPATQLILIALRSQPEGRKGLVQVVTQINLR